jgi:hypothetical protein
MEDDSELIDIKEMKPFFDAVGQRLNVLRPFVVLNPKNTHKGKRFYGDVMIAFNLYQQILQDIVGVTPQQMEEMPDEGQIFKVDPLSIERAVSNDVVCTGYYDPILKEFLNKMAEIDYNVIMDSKYN